MGGHPVEPGIKNLIQKTWLDMRNDSERVVVKEVLESVRHYLHLQNKDNVPLPQLRTVQKIIQEAREKYSERTDEQKLQDKPWTTAASSSHPYHFPPQSIPLLLQLWRYSIHLNHVFTIRHAIWASRLSFQLKDMDIAEIWLHSRQYATEEELSLVSNTPMRTFQLDGSLVMGSMEKITAEGNFKLKDQPFGDIHHTQIKRACDDGIMEEYINVLDDYGRHDSLEQYNELKRLYYLISELPSSSKIFPDMESRMIYLDNLSRISKFPKWKTLTPEEIKEIIIDLRNWTLNVKLRREEPKNNKLPLGILNRLGPDPMLFPTQIYERLGCSLKGEEK
ncbi:hypothetical protein ACFLVB_01750 [Chloroflexota bacterium]